MIFQTLAFVMSFFAICKLLTFILIEIKMLKMINITVKYFGTQCYFVIGKSLIWFV
jgi:hypothetical protein